MGSISAGITAEVQKIKEKVLKYCKDFSPLSSNEIEKCWKVAREKLTNMLTDATTKGRDFREKSKKDIRATVFEKAQLEARYLLREKRAAKEEEMTRKMMSFVSTLFSIANHRTRGRSRPIGR